MRISINIYLIIAAVIATATLNSCSTLKTVSVTATANMQDVTPTTIMQVPKVADLNVDLSHKIAGSAEGTDYDADVEKLKSKATYDLLKQNNADVLVEPVYMVTKITRDGKLSVKVDVMGYAGRYGEIKDLKKSDLESFKAFQKMAPSAPQDSFVKTDTYVKLKGGGTASVQPPATNIMNAQNTPPITRKAPIDQVSLARIHKMKGSGIAQTVLFAPFIAVGGVCVAFGADAGEGSGVALLTTGALMLTSGLVMMVTGPLKIHKANKLKRELYNNNQGSSISFAPMVSPNIMGSANTALGVSMKLNF